MRKVYVGLSGGVDSGTSAALLQREGYDVAGVFIKIWQPEFIECTWREDRLDAMRIAAALSIPFREIDLSDEYKREVVDAMVADYQKGITPNPDVLCNEKIKFGVFMRWALSEGADMVATGHYAQVWERDGKKVLMRGVDPGKDQSYFLYRISSEDLERVLFPIGGMHKKDVRMKAEQFGLPVAAKPDSQGLCFVGDVSMRDFLRRYIELEEGRVLDTQGSAIGVHDGAALYTIGQRHGFTIGKDPAGSARFITKIDTASNTITVSPRRDDAASSRIEVRDMHWISGIPALPAHSFVQTRYHEAPVAAELSQRDGKLSAAFDSPHIASPGQSLVVYDGDICLGGGTINS